MSIKVKDYNNNTNKYYAKYYFAKYLSINILYRFERIKKGGCQSRTSCD